MSDVVKLNRPVVHEGTTYDTVTIDEPTVAGLMAYEKEKANGGGDMAATVAMLAKDIGWPMAVLEQIRASDLTRISEAMAPFVTAATAGSRTGQ